MLPIFVLLLGLAAVSQAQAAGRTLTVGYYDFPPVMYGDSHGVTRGEMAELTRLVLRRAGYRPRFRRLPSARLYTALKSGSVDIWLGAPGKPELRAHTRESAHSLGRVDLNLYHRADTPAPRIPESLVGQGVIVINGYSYWPSVNQLLQDPALDIRLLRTATHESALAMLRYRRADFPARLPAAGRTGPARPGSRAAAAPGAAAGADPFHRVAPCRRQRGGAGRPGPRLSRTARRRPPAQPAGGQPQRRGFARAVGSACSGSSGQ